MTLESPADTIIYRSKLNPKINRNFEIFAVLSQHIPDKGVQMIRYYGLYSNPAGAGRGCARKGTGHGRSGGHLKSQFTELKSLPPGSPPPPLTLPSRKWRDLIRQAWHVDPLQCPVCQKQMRLIAFLDNPEVVEKILRHWNRRGRPEAGRPEAIGFSSSLQPKASSLPHARLRKRDNRLMVHSIDAHQRA